MVLWKTSALGKKEKNKLKDKVDGDEEKGNKKRDLLLFLMFVTNQKNSNVMFHNYCDRLKLAT